MGKYILSSHNSWSFLSAKKWWMRPFAFMARCQRIDIYRQYQLGVRCFDLRIKFDKSGRLQVAHGMMVYDINSSQLKEHLQWIHDRGDCMVRVLHEVRRKAEYTEESVRKFGSWCKEMEVTYHQIDFWGGNNLYNWNVDYDFWCKPTCEEIYASVRPPRLIDDWWPWLYARLNNKHIKQAGTTKDILMIDFVDIG